MSTIHTDELTQSDLKAYCKKNGITQGDFVKSALVYFKKSGINPSESPESVKEELAKIDKRINQVIAFQKKFESDNLIPLLTALTKTEAKVNHHLSDIPDKVNTLAKQSNEIAKAVNGLLESFNKVSKILTDNENNTAKRHRDLAEETSKNQKNIIAYLNAIMKYGTGTGTFSKTSIQELYNKDNPK